MLGASRSEPAAELAASLQVTGDERRSDDNGSLATENSDEEPLDGELAAHVEEMLRGCLDPEERQEPDSWRRAIGLGGDGSGMGDEDWEQRLLAVGRGGDQDAASESDNSEAEDLEEAAALAQHADIIKMGLQDLFDWGHAHLLEAQQAPEATARRDTYARAMPAPLRQQLEDLREMQRQLRSLAVEHQALLMHYSQRLLFLADAQATLATRHHQSARQRHKQLRIVRRESSRLCVCIEELSKRKGLEL